MKEEVIHEGCIEQIQNACSRTFIYVKNMPVDGQGQIRIRFDWENMRMIVQPGLG